MNRRVLFYRHFRGLSGGHLKVWDYFRHVEETNNHEPWIYFSPESNWDEDNPWLPLRTKILSEWRPEASDIWFLAGMDWNMLSQAQRVRPPVPVVNLIQGVRHANPDLPLYEFLSYPAVRLCVSREVADAVQATGRVNGPLQVIENGIDPAGWPAPRPWGQRRCDVLVCGHKQPALARKLVDQFPPNFKVSLLETFIPRAQFLAKLADTRVAICLPHEQEGFYLPALEAMAQGALVVCPDCVGNRGFCLHKRTCLIPAMAIEELTHAALQALLLPEAGRERFQEKVSSMVARHSLERERRAFQDVLAELDDLWQQVHLPAGA